MRILFDHQIFESQKVGGISRYHIELHKALNKMPDVNTEISIKYSNNLYLEEENKDTKPLFDDYEKFITPHEFPSKRRLFNYVSRICPFSSSILRNEAHSNALLNKGNYDVFHPTYYNNYFLEHVKTPYVITVHDMIQENHPEFFVNDYTFRIKQNVINNAARIIAISNYTKEQLLSYYDIPDKKVSVVYHGFNVEERKEDTCLGAIHNKPYLLFVGNRYGYKNFFFILKALVDFLPKNDIDLVCVGPELTKYETELVKFLKLSNFISVRSNVDDQLLFHYYQQSLCFIFPSLEEGFGLPIFEALSAKTAMLLSDIPVFREIAGDTGVYFSPYCQREFLDRLNYVLNNINYLKTCSSQQFQMYKSFTWDKTARETLQVYNTII